MARKRNGGLWGGALRQERQAQYEGEDSARVGDLRGRSHPDDGTQLNPKLDGYIPQTKAERRAWKRKRDANN
jgi:hypothetical protein